MLVTGPDFNILGQNDRFITLGNLWPSLTNVLLFHCLDKDSIVDFDPCSLVCLTDMAGNIGRENNCLTSNTNKRSETPIDEKAPGSERATL